MRQETSTAKPPEPVVHYIAYVEVRTDGSLSYAHEPYCPACRMGLPVLYPAQVEVSKN